MKLNAINSINNYASKKIQTKEITKLNNNFVSNSISKNSLQETLGRSQVSFKGTGKLTQKGFEYEQKSAISHAGEDLKYNAYNGELEYWEHNPNGEERRYIHIIPSERTRIVVDYNDGYTTRTTQSPKGQIIETKDELGRQIYLELTNTQQQKKIVETDYDRKRRVITLSAPELKEKVQVFDLNTGESVTKGPLVEDRIEVEDGVFETTNIVTGEVYKRETFTNRGRNIKITDYSRETGIITKETLVEKGGTTVTTFNEKGVKQRTINTDKKGTKIIYTFGEDGIHETSRIEKQYDSEGKLAKQTTYQPNTDIIQNIIELGKNSKEKTIHYYNTFPNVRSYSEIKVGDRVTKCTYYYDNGIKPKRVLTYFDNGGYVEELFEDSGKKPLSQAMYFDSNGTMKKVEKYDTTTGKMYESREIHPNMHGWYIIKNFDDYTGKLTKKDTVTSKDVVMERVFYHENGQVPRKVIKFNKDRSYSVTCYDEGFKVLSTKEYNADKTPRIKSDN
ncbi:MAG: hypothetical protein IJB79_05935 [Candidatus Gastranaerophilales bacterium]|nr:hypothetical protein [Candidatus Gastranaerophilales bacterium]